MSNENLRVAAATTTGGAIGTAGSVATIAAAGSVPGLSAAGVTSGLAAVGSVVGGGMAAGIGVAAAPALALGAIGAAMTSDDIPNDEKVAVGVGAAAGVGGTLATVSAAGATAGLSAAGITSGLAAVGSVVGGGMVAGVAVASAAPLVAAATIYGIYKWFKD